GGFSAHASQSQLLDWALQFDKPRPKLCLVHGDADAKVALRERFKNQGWDARIPTHAESISF
ncbi:MAG: MBL fold metallo-hydrolase RNA specificity domain-containing protein, partial [Lysobacterales bacterium]